METIGGIRREHFIKGKIKEIVRNLKVSRNTVRRVLRWGATCLESTNERFSLDRSSGDGQKNSMRSWQATRPSLLASN